MAEGVRGVCPPVAGQEAWQIPPAIRDTTRAQKKNLPLGAFGHAAISCLSEMSTRMSLSLRYGG